MVTNIVADIVNAICNFVQKLIAILLTTLVDLFGFNEFLPTLDFFRDEVLGGQDNLDIITTMFRDIGLVAMVILIGFNFFTMVFTGIVKEKEVLETARTMLPRFVICILLFTTSVSFLDIFADVFTTINDEIIVATFGDKKADIKGILDASPEKTTLREHWESVLNGKYDTSDIDTENATGSESYSIMDEDTTVQITPIDIAALSTGTASVIFVVYLVTTALIRTFLMGAVLFNFAKLVVELIKRYVTMCFLYITFPAVISTYITQATEKIFTSWISSFISTSIALLATQFIIKLFIFILDILPATIVGSLFMIALINLGLRLEQFMKDHGFVMASSGGSLLDSMMQSAHNMQTLVKGATAGAGGAIIAGAALSNNVPMGRVGSALAGKGISDAATLSAMQNSLGGALNRAMNGGNEHVGRGEFGALDNLFRRSGDNMQRGQFLSSFNAMGADDKNNYLNHLVNDVIGADNISKAMGMPQGVGKIDPSSLSMDSRGNIVGSYDNGLARTQFSLGTDAMPGKESIKFDADNGDGMHLSTMGSEINDNIQDAVLSDFISPDRIDENGHVDLSDNPLSTVAGFSGDDLTSLMNHYGDDDLSHYHYANNEGVGHIDYMGNNNYNGLLTAPNGQTYMQGNVSSDFGRSASPSKLMNDSNFMSSFGAAGVQKVIDVSYIDQNMGSAKGYKLNCSMKDGSRETFFYTPASSAKLSNNTRILRHCGVLSKPRNTGSDS